MQARPEACIDDLPAKILRLGEMAHRVQIAGRSRRIKPVQVDVDPVGVEKFTDLALVCTGLGWTEHAFEWLDKAHQERSGWLTYLKADPRLDTLRGDPRFNELLRRVRLIP
jgi:hypothetical protein